MADRERRLVRNLGDGLSVEEGFSDADRSFILCHPDTYGSTVAARAMGDLPQLEIVRNVACPLGEAYIINPARILGGD